MHHLVSESYRSLELLCRQQAALSSTTDARLELEAMAREYAAMADWLEQQWPEESAQIGTT
jgi:uncharacterized lipoprotein YmbA